MDIGFFIEQNYIILYLQSVGVKSPKLPHILQVVGDNHNTILTCIPFVWVFLLWQLSLNKIGGWSQVFLQQSVSITMESCNVHLQKIFNNNKKPVHLLRVYLQICVPWQVATLPPTYQNHLQDSVLTLFKVTDIKSV